MKQCAYLLFFSQSYLYSIQSSRFHEICHSTERQIEQMVECKSMCMLKEKYSTNARHLMKTVSRENSRNSRNSYSTFPTNARHRVLLFS